MSIRFLLTCLKMKEIDEEMWAEHGVFLPGKEDGTLREEYLEMISSATSLIIHEAASCLGVLSKSYKSHVAEGADEGSTRNAELKSILKNKNDSFVPNEQNKSKKSIFFQENLDSTQNNHDVNLHLKV